MPQAASVSSKAQSSSLDASLVEQELLLRLQLLNQQELLINGKICCALSLALLPLRLAPLQLPFCADGLATQTTRMRALLILT
eukprot:3274077-Rhodomonas_salina.1